MAYDIFKSSEIVAKTTQSREKWAFPWEALECGQSFAVPKDKIKLTTLRSKASIQGQKLNRKFRVVEHDAVYEVGRLE